MVRAFAMLSKTPEGCDPLDELVVVASATFPEFNSSELSEDCTVTASELLMAEVSSGVILPSRVGGGTDSCPSPWGRLSMDELERGESGIKSSDSNREARLQGPLGVLPEKEDTGRW